MAAGLYFATLAVRDYQTSPKEDRVVTFYSPSNAVVKVVKEFDVPDVAANYTLSIRHFKEAFGEGVPVTVNLLNKSHRVQYIATVNGIRFFANDELNDDVNSYYSKFEYRYDGKSIVVRNAYNLKWWGVMAFAVTFCSFAVGILLYVIYFVICLGAKGVCWLIDRHREGTARWSEI